MPINPITEKQAEECAADHSYARNRWEYWKFVVEFAKMVPRESVLEIGPAMCPVFPEADFLDRTTKFLGERVRYCRKAEEVPWPINDKAYDLVVACQVWEHLKPEMRAPAFREAVRISRASIFTFPLEWDCPNNVTHHMHTREDIGRWCCGLTPEKEKVVGKPKRMRLIQFFHTENEII